MQKLITWFESKTGVTQLSTVGLTGLLGFVGLTPDHVFASAWQWLTAHGSPRTLSALTTLAGLILAHTNADKSILDQK